MRIDADQAASLPQLSVSPPVADAALPIGVKPGVPHENSAFVGDIAEALERFLDRLWGGNGGSQVDIDPADIPSQGVSANPGDTAETLADEFGTTVEQLETLNPGTDLTDIRPGDTVNVPTNRQVVQLREGQTLESVAGRYGVSVEQLQRANGIADTGSVQVGDRFAVVPPVTYGLDRDASVQAYVDDVRPLQADWANLTPAERLERLGDALNEQLTAAGVPEARVLAGGVGTANGVYDFTENAIRIDPAVLNSDTIAQGDLRGLADTLYHEGRHAEQWHDMARVHVAQGGDPAELGITAANAQAARDAPALDLESDRGRFAEAMFQSVYGTGAADRNNILSNITAENYEDYRALPEEADAWRVGGKILNLWPRS